MPDFYGTTAGADTYHAARANAAWTGDDAAKTAALVRASAYIDGRYQYKYLTGRWISAFSGAKTGGRAQALQWPRTDATDYEGNALPTDLVPLEIEQAAYEAAIRELTKPGSLSPDYVPATAIKTQRVDTLSIEYFAPASADAIPTRPIIAVIDELVAPLLTINAAYAATVYVV